MRFVPVNILREGMCVGKSVYDRNNQLLLGKGSLIRESYINKLLEMGYQGIYIEDTISSDIEVKDIIHDELRRKTVNIIKDVFVETNHNNNDFSNYLIETKLLMTQIVEELLENRDTIVNLIDLKIFDDYTFYHSVNVAVLSILLGTTLELNKEQLYNLGLGAILHDIGKMFIDNSILNKKGKLTDEEFFEIQKHPQYGYKYLKETFQIPLSSYVAVLQHHEKYNGTGYPNRISKDKISLFAQIISIADVYDALTSNRPYRKALLPSEAIEYIMGNGGVMFDIKLVKRFISKIAPYPVGTGVELSNKYKGFVVENYEDAILRPRIKVVLDDNNKEINGVYFNLRNEKSLRNVTIVSNNLSLTPQLC
ncbi:MAG: HD-GYP domain-containing protein [Vallitalea sp.]|jgi:HD-GYP domain-containing protein (c-di-GMP phosphodiesterase class II)|nr:HD-GYP domain-containing protein [Vallitalea sp.]